jgi:polyphosphate kinase 2 (PPK2 family)
LASFGAVITKFWLHLSPEEQLRRFEQRQATPYKQWKLTDEDWRNREKWDQYAQAVGEMIQRTSTPQAPWTIVEAESKQYARTRAIRTVVDAMQAALQQHVSHGR